MLKNRLLGMILAVLMLAINGLPWARAGTAGTSTSGLGLAFPEAGSLKELRAQIGHLTLLNGWVKAMARCESWGNPLAVNEKDLDGTPSYGLYQFKPGTFRHYVRKYGLFDWEKWTAKDWKSAIWNGEYQETVFRKMIIDSEVDLRREFPGCTRKLGLPPRTGELTLLQ